MVRRYMARGTERRGPAARPDGREGHASDPRPGLAQRCGFAEVRWARRFVAVLALLVPIACGERGPSQYIGADAAYVRCVTAGPHKLQPILLEMPVPSVPTGFYAHQLDPIALDALGFERDEAACAILHAPTQEVASSVVGSYERLIRTQDEVSRAAEDALGPCVCEVAKHLGAYDLLTTCTDRPTRPGCSVGAADEAKLGEVLAPLRAQLAQTIPARMHWRLVGKTDRPGWFASRVGRLVAKHPFGSVVFLPGQEVPARPSQALIRALLEADDVVAVVQQDSGQALLVARERSGGELVLDHFAYPRVRPRRRGLVAALDDATIAHTLAELEPTSEREPLGADVRTGNVVSLRHDPLRRIDALRVGATWLDLAYRTEVERVELGERHVDRVTLVAPFGREGRVLTGTLALSEAGRAWAKGLEDRAVGPTLEEFGLTPSTYAVFIPSEPSSPFVLRGEPLERIFFYGLASAPELFRSLEAAHPHTVKGRTHDLTLDLPVGPLAEISTWPGLAMLRTRVSHQPQRLRAQVRPDEGTVTFELGPR